MLNNLKTRAAMNAKISMFVICVQVITYLLIYNLHDCTFNCFYFVKNDLNIRHCFLCCFFCDKFISSTTFLYLVKILIVLILWVKAFFLHASSFIKLGQSITDRNLHKINNIIRTTQSQLHYEFFYSF